GTRKFNTSDISCGGALTPTNSAPLQDNGIALNGAPCTGAPTNFGYRVPDIIVNARIDQAWGFIGISGALHDVSGAYWFTPNVVNNGHPADKYGWAGAIGGLFNVPGTQGDQ